MTSPMVDRASSQKTDTRQCPRQSYYNTIVRLLARCSPSVNCKCLLLIQRCISVRVLPVGFEPTMYLTSRFYRPLPSPIWIRQHGVASQLNDLIRNIVKRLPSCHQQQATNNICCIDNIKSPQQYNSSRELYTVKMLSMWT